MLVQLVLHSDKKSTFPEGAGSSPTMCSFEKGHIKKDIFQPEKGHITLAQKFGSSDRCHLVGTLEVVLRAFAHTGTPKSRLRIVSFSQKIRSKQFDLF